MQGLILVSMFSMYNVMYGNTIIVLFLFELPILSVYM